MNEYLRVIKSKWVDGFTGLTVHVVIGNESCDLDSSVSAITYGFYLNSVNRDPKVVIVPIQNIQSSQFRLRTETTHFFKKLKIPTVSLIFKDQLNLNTLHQEGRLIVTLVDHNALTGSDVIYEDCVISVVDHHVRERPEKDGVSVKLDFVGSCSTLVAEELLDDPDFTVDDTVAELLYGTILVDTINRSAHAGKTTPRDEIILERLHSLVPHVKGDNLFQELQAAKFNISDLLNMEILEKDLKMVDGSMMKIAMASVTMEMTELLGRPEFKQDLGSFSKAKKADVVVIMTLVNDEDDKPSRQIAVYSEDRIFREQIADRLDNASEVDLELEMINPPFDDITVYNQGNTQASRKKVMPVLKSFLHGDITPDVSSKEFVTQTSVAMAAEGFSSFSVMVDSNIEEKNTLETDSDKNVVFNLGSVEGEISSVSGGMSPQITGSNDDLVDLENQNSSNMASSETVKPAATSDFDILSPGQDIERNVTQNASEKVSHNPFGEIPSTGVKFLSSANSSNLLDFVISDSELVDPFSSVEETTQSNVAKIVPKEKNVSKSDAMEPKEEYSSEMPFVNKENITNPFFEIDTAFGTERNTESVGDSSNPFGDTNFDPFQTVQSDSVEKMDDVNTTSNVKLVDTLDSSMGDNLLVDLASEFGQTENVSETREQKNARQLVDFGDFSTESDYSENVPETREQMNAGQLVDFGDFSTESDYSENIPETEVQMNARQPVDFGDFSTESDYSENVPETEVQMNARQLVDFGDFSTESDYSENVPETEVQKNARQLVDFGDFSTESDPSEKVVTDSVTGDLENPFQINSDMKLSEGMSEPNDDIQIDIGVSEPKDLLNVDSLKVSGRSLSEKSVSLTVECDARSQADNLAELDESDLFDKVPTPEILHSGENSPFVNSGMNTPYEGENSPFVNSGMSTPFEGLPVAHLRTGSESDSMSRNGTVVPPNSLMDRGFEGDFTDHDLPSFNSAEMVQRIQKKKASLGSGLDFLELAQASEGYENDQLSIPYTPQNSFRDDMETFIQDRSLPSWNNSNMVEKVQQKRVSIGAGLDIHLGEFESHQRETTSDDIGPSGNPFGDFSNNLSSSTGFESHRQLNPFLQIDDDKDLDKIDSLDHVPFTPVNTFVDTTPEHFMKNRNSLTDPELMEKLNELKLEKDGDPELGTNPFDFMGNVSENQTGSQDLVDIFGVGSSINENQSENVRSLNPFADFENITSSTTDGQDNINTPGQSDVIDTTNGNQNDDSLMFEMEQTARDEAIDSVAKSFTREIIHNAMETYPDLTNQTMAGQVAMEILQTDNADWMKQGSGDSGIGSTDSPQQAQGGSQTRRLVQEYSVETEYLPYMDPLHGSLNMISSPTSMSRSVETDADKEVVEGESFRKVSGTHQLEETIQHINQSAPSIKPPYPEQIRDMIIQENMEEACKLVETSDIQVVEHENDEKVDDTIEENTDLVDIDDVKVEEKEEAEYAHIDEDLEDNPDLSGTPELEEAITIINEHTDEIDENVDAFETPDMKPIENIDKQSGEQSIETLLDETDTRDKPTVKEPATENKGVVKDTRETVNDLINKTGIDNERFHDKVTEVPKTSIEKDSASSMIDLDLSNEKGTENENFLDQHMEVSKTSVEKDSESMIEPDTELETVDKPSYVDSDVADIQGDLMSGTKMKLGELRKSGKDSNLMEENSISPDSSSSYGSTSESESELITVKEITPNIDKSDNTINDLLDITEEETNAVNNLLDIKEGEGNTGNNLLDSKGEANTNNDLLDIKDKEDVHDLLDINEEGADGKALTDISVEIDIESHKVPDEGDLLNMEPVKGGNDIFDMIGTKEKRTHSADDEDGEIVIDAKTKNNETQSVPDLLNMDMEQSENVISGSGVLDIKEQWTGTKLEPESDLEVKIDKEVDRTAFGITSEKTVHDDFMFDSSNDNTINNTTVSQVAADLGLFNTDSVVPMSAGVGTENVAVSSELVSLDSIMNTASPNRESNIQDTYDLDMVGSHMTESAVTVETISPVETPADEHVSGFYEVNPEDMTSGSVNILTSSAYSTNLGENETGFYEVNPEMITSTGSPLPTDISFSGDFAPEKPVQDDMMGSVSSVETPENENVSGYYDMNKEDDYPGHSTNMGNKVENDTAAEHVANDLENIDVQQTPPEINIELASSTESSSTNEDEQEPTCDKTAPNREDQVKNVSGKVQNEMSDTQIEENKENIPQTNVVNESFEMEKGTNILMTESNTTVESQDSDEISGAYDFTKIDNEIEGELIEDDKNYNIDLMNNTTMESSSEPILGMAETNESSIETSSNWDLIGSTNAGTPKITVEMTESTDTIDSEVTGFYEMNAEIQGTVLQNIEIGNAFSPIESPNEEVFALEYDINPMVPEVKSDSFDSEFGENKGEFRENKDLISKPFVRFAADSDSDVETFRNDKVEEMADYLVKEAFNEALETFSSQRGLSMETERQNETVESPDNAVGFKTEFEVTSDIVVSQDIENNNVNLLDNDDNIDQVEVEKEDTEANDHLFKIADSLVNEALVSAVEIIEDLGRPEPETHVLTDMSNSINDFKPSDDVESSDSDASSTTTEGSYRIINSEELSPVRSPDKEITAVTAEEINSLRLEVTSPDKDGITLPIEDTTSFSVDVTSPDELSSPVDDFSVEENSSALDSMTETKVDGKIPRDGSYKSFTFPEFEDNGEISNTVKSVPDLISSVGENTERKTPGQVNSHELERDTGDVNKKIGTKVESSNFARQDTVVPDIIIITEDAPNEECNIGYFTEADISEINDKDSEDESESEAQETEGENDKVKLRSFDEGGDYKAKSGSFDEDVNVESEAEEKGETDEGKSGSFDSKEIVELESHKEGGPGVIIEEIIEEKRADQVESIVDAGELSDPLGNVVNESVGEISDAQEKINEINSLNDDLVKINEMQEKTDKMERGTCVDEGKVDGMEYKNNDNQESAMDINSTNDHVTEKVAEIENKTDKIEDKSITTEEMAMKETGNKEIDGVTDNSFPKPVEPLVRPKTRREIFVTSAGRMSVSVDPPSDSDPGTVDAESPMDIIHEEPLQRQNVSHILARTGSVLIHADEILTRLSDATIEQLNYIADNTGTSQPVDDDDYTSPDKHVIREKHQDNTDKPQVPVVKPKTSHEKVKVMDDTQEWHEDPIPGMGATQVESESDSDSDTDSEYTKPARPDSLLNGARRKKKISATNIVTPDSADDLIEGVDDIPTPDDLETPDDLSGELEWEDDTPITPGSSDNRRFVDYMDRDDEQEKYENTKFRKVEIAGKDYRVDMKVIEPYKKVLSHGGYYGDGLNAIILFCGCYLPDRGRHDYQYVMDNLFLYVISTLELLVAEDYMIVYFHGATPRRQMPSFGWLKRCYQMIDRRLRKNLKALLMVHPTLWLKTVVLMTKPFISSKFSSKLRFVKTIHELGKIVPMEYIYIPDPVQHTERMLQTDPLYLEKWEKELEKKGQQSKKKTGFFNFKKKK